MTTLSDQSLLTSPLASFDLNNTYMMIVGAGQGIGRACAHDLTARGAQLILFDKNAEQLESLFDELCDTYELSEHHQPLLIHQDLSTLDQSIATQLRDHLTTHLPHLDGVVFTAAMLGDQTTLDQYAFSTWQTLMNVNLSSQFLLYQQLLPILKASPSASIVFTTDELGIQPKAYWGAYAVSKCALEALFMLIHDELKAINSSTKVHLIDPGKVNTTMRQAAFPGENPHHNPSTSDVAPFFSFLLSSASQHLNGKRCHIAF